MKSKVLNSLNPKNEIELALVGVVIFLFYQTMLGAGIEQGIGAQEQNDDTKTINTGQTVNVLQYGFDANDATVFLQAAIDSGAMKVIVPNNGKIWNLRPVRLAGDQELVIEPGVQLRAKKGAFKGKNDCLLSGDNLSDVTIVGYEAEISMWKNDYTGPGYKKSEWRHLISLTGCSDVSIIGLKIADSGGDGIYIGSRNNIHCKNIIIKDCRLTNNLRQGLSVTSVDNLSIENCTFEKTKGTKPGAGIDIEPNRPKDPIKNIRISRCTFSKNRGAGLLIWLDKLNSQSRPVTVNCVDSRFYDCPQHAVTIGKVPENLHGVIHFGNCKFEDVALTGLFMADKPADSVKVVLDNCTWINVANSRKFTHKHWLSPFYFEIRNEKTKSIGNVEFRDSHLYDDKDRPFLVISNEGKPVREIYGKIVIHSRYQRAGNIKSDTLLNLPALKILNRQ